MQTELKNAIRFDDFYAVFGAPGVVAMAWWLGAKHAELIRAEQQGFPFLYITGRTGSGKTSLLSYLSTLNGFDSVTCCAPGYATARGLARTLSNAGDQPIILEDSYDQGAGAKFDWDQIASLYDSGTISVRSQEALTQVRFKGTLVISANPPIECSKQLENRMVRIDLTAPHTSESRHHAQALHELTADQAMGFGRAVQERTEQTMSTVKRLTPPYTVALYDKHPAQPTARAAQIGGLLMALVDVLSLLLNLTQEQRQGALDQIAQSAGLAAMPY